MKVGDLVKLSPIDYPQYVNLKGILMEEFRSGTFTLKKKEA